MMGAAVAAAMGGCMTTDAEDLKPCRKTSAAADKLPARNRHPYKDVDWATALQIRGTTHMHCKTQEELRSTGTRSSARG